MNHIIFDETRVVFGWQKCTLLLALLKLAASSIVQSELSSVSPKGVKYICIMLVEYVIDNLVYMMNVFTCGSARRDGSG